MELDASKTRNELSCRALNSILVYMEENFGREELETMVSKTGLPLEYLKDQNNWVSWSYYASLLEALVDWTGDPATPYLAGTYSWHKKSWGYFYYVTYALGNVKKVLQKLTNLVQHFNKGAEWEILTLHDNKATIRIRMKNGYSAKRVCCESRMGQLAGIPKAFGMPLGKTREIKCQALGDDACVCEMTWLNRPKRFFGLIGILPGLVLIHLLQRFGYLQGFDFFGILLILFFGYFVGRLIDFKSVIRHYQEQTDALEESVKVIESKYLNLQKAHDGLFAVHEISLAVTSIHQVDEVLNILLKMVVERLGFDRSMVMLTDEKAGALHHGKIFGDDAVQEFFSGLKIPLDLNSPMAVEVLQKRLGQIVTQDFIKGDQASELEKRIFEITGTREYVIAPLVWKDQILGVLAADNIRTGKKINEQEKVLMVSLANQAAMAIENARSFQTIEDLNVNLEKKVDERTRELERSLQELKKAQEQLVHSEKMSSLGLLCSGLAHEINNPVNFAYNGITAIRESMRKINALADALAGSERDAADLKAELLAQTRDTERLMQIVDTGLKRTRNLVADLKHFSRKDQKVTELVEIRTILDSVLTLLNHELGGRIQVHMELGSPDRIQAYSDQLNQVFLNLMLNAIQSIPEEGNIWIHVTPGAPGEVLIRFRDDGTGIREEDLPRIFEPFFTTKQSGLGTGLGMSICRRIIENHHGKIDVTSDMGRGTEVTVTLPVRMNCSEPDVPSLN